MELKMRAKWFSLKILFPFILFLCGVGYLFAAPYITAYQIKIAADNQDGEALARHVDFPVLQKNLKDQLNEKFKKKAAQTSESDPIGSMGMIFGGMVVEKMVDSYVTPKGIAALMKGKKKSAALSNQATGGGDSEASSQPFTSASASYVAFNTFSIVIKDDEADREVKFILRRRGLDWKLTDIVLP